MRLDFVGKFQIECCGDCLEREMVQVESLGLFFWRRTVANLAISDLRIVAGAGIARAPKNPALSLISFPVRVTARRAVAGARNENFVAYVLSHYSIGGRNDSCVLFWELTDATLQYVFFYMIIGRILQGKDGVPIQAKDARCCVLRQRVVN